MTPPNLKVDVTISCCSAGTDRFMRLQFVDSVARVTFLEVQMTMEEFANCAMGSMQQSNIPAIVRRLDLLGMKAENKTVWVPYTQHLGSAETGTPARSAEAEALAPFEVDGWRGDADDIRNTHRRSTQDGVEGYSVIFRRHVPVEARDLLAKDREAAQ